MADHDEVLPEETSGYKLSQPKQSLAEYQQMGELASAFNNSVQPPSSRFSAFNSPYNSYVRLACLGLLVLVRLGLNPRFRIRVHDETSKYQIAVIRLDHCHLRLEIRHDMAR